jgi:hypothetical protein
MRGKHEGRRGDQAREGSSPQIWIAAGTTQARSKHGRAPLPARALLEIAEEEEEEVNASPAESRSGGRRGTNPPNFIPALFFPLRCVQLRLLFAC